MIDDPKKPEDTSENSEFSDRNPQVSESAEANNIDDGSNIDEATTSKSDVSEDRDISSENEEVFAAFQQENANLKKLLDEKTQQADVAKAQYARLAADFENFRRRTAKEKENLEVQAKKNIISELLPVIDNFERARSQIKPDSEGEMTIHSSYQGVYKTLVGCLKRMGVSAMNPEGEQFDPNFHEAMLREATDEHPEGTVIEQLMRGYVLGETILRHAMVKVAVPKEPVITSEEEKTEEVESAENEDS